MATAFLTTGQYVNFRLKKRVDSLNNLIVLIENINSQITFSQKSIMNVINDSSSNNENELRIIKEFVKNQHLDLTDNWQNSVNSFGRYDCLNEEDRKILFSFGKELGTTDLQGQRNNCNLHIDLLKKQLESAAKTVREKSKMNTAVSFFLASVSVIILY